MSDEMSNEEEVVVPQKSDDLNIHLTDYLGSKEEIG